jgi:hypothetical protein
MRHTQQQANAFLLRGCILQEIARDRQGDLIPLADFQTRAHEEVAEKMKRQFGARRGSLRRTDPGWLVRQAAPKRVAHAARMHEPLVLGRPTKAVAVRIVDREARPAQGAAGSAGDERGFAPVSRARRG